MWRGKNVIRQDVVEISFEVRDDPVEKVGKSADRMKNLRRLRHGPGGRRAARPFLPCQNRRLPCAGDWDGSGRLPRENCGGWGIPSRTSAGSWMAWGQN